MKNFVSGLVVVALLAAQPALAKRSPHLASPVAPALPVEVHLTQQEIAVDVPDNGAVAAYAVGGVLGALVGAAINNAATKKAETRVVDVRNALIDYDFNGRVEAALREVDLTALSPDPQVQFIRDAVAAPERPTEVAPFVYQIVPSYGVTNDFETMRVSIDVRLLSQELKRNGKVKMRWVYTRNYTWTMRMPPVRGGKDEDAGRMAALGTDGLTRLIDRGMDEVVDMFVYDLTQAARDEIDSVPRGRAPSHSLADISIAGHKLRGDDETMVVRLHRINSIRGVQVIDPEALAAEAAAAGDAAPAVDGAVAPAVDTVDTADTVDTVDSVDSADAAAAEPVGIEE